MRAVNNNGLEQIRVFLRDNHKLSRAVVDGETVLVDYFDRAMLLAWAEEAEDSLSNGNSATIEIKSFDSASGAATCYTITSEGIDNDE